jgi:hypothetical protein
VGCAAHRQDCPQTIIVAACARRWSRPTHAPRWRMRMRASAAPSATRDTSPSALLRAHAANVGDQVHRQPITAVAITAHTARVGNHQPPDPASIAPRRQSSPPTPPDVADVVLLGAYIRCAEWHSGLPDRAVSNHRDDWRNAPRGVGHGGLYATEVGWPCTLGDMTTDRVYDTHQESGNSPSRFQRAEKTFVCGETFSPT